MSRKLIRGGRVIDPANGIDAIADVWIQDGRIDAVTSVREESDADIDWRDTGDHQRSRHDCVSGIYRRMSHCEAWLRRR
ncbi:MAG: hypothetical protein U0936_17460 [Planctomycetaceae bacterium]